MSVFTGIDGLQRALFTGATAFFGCVAVGVTAARVGLGPAAACAGLAVAAVVVIRTTTRFRLTIGDDLLLVRTVAGVPYARLRYLLDHEITLYEAFEDDVAESVALRAPFSPFAPHVEEELFGPYSWGTDRAVLPEMFDLHRAALEALGAARARVPPRAPGFWIGGHRVAEREIEAHHPSGRVARIKLQRDRHLMGLDLPAGTVLYTNLGAPQEWVHPDRPDRIDEVEAPSGLPVPGGLRSAPGARVSIDALARVRRASAVAGCPVSEGLPVDGAAPITWDERGRLAACTLGAPLSVGPGELLPGDTVALRSVAPVWVRLGSPRVLAGRSFPRGAHLSLTGPASRLRLRAAYWHEGDRMRSLKIRFGAWYRA